MLPINQEYVEEKTDKHPLPQDVKAKLGFYFPPMLFTRNLLL